MKWEIVSLERQQRSGLVCVSHWRLTNSVNNVFNEFNGSVELPLKDIDDSTFVEFDDITEDIALEWTKNTLGVEKVSAYESAILLNQNKSNKKLAPGVPWSNGQTIKSAA
jgi:hypothetical protein